MSQSARCIKVRWLSSIKLCSWLFSTSRGSFQDFCFSAVRKNKSHTGNFRRFFFLSFLFQSSEAVTFYQQMRGKKKKKEASAAFWQQPLYLCRFLSLLFFLVFLLPPRMLAGCFPTPWLLTSNLLSVSNICCWMSHWIWQEMWSQNIFVQVKSVFATSEVFYVLQILLRNVYQQSQPEMTKVHPVPQCLLQFSEVVWENSALRVVTKGPCFVPRDVKDAENCQFYHSFFMHSCKHRAKYSQCGIYRVVLGGSELCKALLGIILFFFFNVTYTKQ